MKTFHCKDIGIDCDWQVSSNDENDMINRAKEHGREQHNIDTFSQEKIDQIRANIHDDQAA